MTTDASLGPYFDFRSGLLTRLGSVNLLMEWTARALLDFLYAIFVCLFVFFFLIFSMENIHGVQIHPLLH